MAEESTIEKVEWNLSSAIISEIAGMLQRASLFYLAGKIQKCFYCLNSIRMRIVQNLSQEERKEFKKLESSLFHEKNNRNKFEILLEQYNTLLMDKLEKYGFLLQKKADRTGLAA